MLYMHIPFLQRLCPYCSFNRYPFREDIARADTSTACAERCACSRTLATTSRSIYCGGGTPTILIDELCQTLDLARDLFSIQEISCETNPTPPRQAISRSDGRSHPAPVGRSAELRRRLATADGPVREIRQRQGDLRAHRRGGGALRHPQRRHDLQLPFADRIGPSARYRAHQGMRLPANDLLAPGLSRATTKKMLDTLGSPDYEREYAYYRLLDAELADGDDAAFERRTVWTFNRADTGSMPAARYRSTNSASPMRNTPPSEFGCGHASRRHHLRQHIQPARIQRSNR